MCLYTNMTEAKVAKRDIVCYKYMLWDGVDFISPYKLFIYRLNQEYKEKAFVEMVITQSWDNLHPIHFGFHSCSRRKYARQICSNTGVIFKCIIPKGSLYWIDLNKHEYCSNKIKAVAWSKRFGLKWNYVKK